MATFFFEGDELMECPYNPLHRVLSKRLHTHMDICSKEDNAPKLVICPFNSLHRVYPDELKVHSLECEDNRQAIRELIKKGDGNGEGDDNTPSSSTSDNRADAWDSAYSGQLVIPKAYDLNANAEVEDGVSGFLPPSRLYGLKRSEKKRLYNQLSENLIRKAAQEERENLTEAEANELGLPYERPPDFTIDTHGQGISDTEPVASSSRIENDNEATEEITRPKIKEESAETIPRRSIKRRLDEEEEEDNKGNIDKETKFNCFITKQTR